MTSPHLPCCLHSQASLRALIRSLHGREGWRVGCLLFFLIIVIMLLYKSLQILQYYRHITGNEILLHRSTLPLNNIRHLTDTSTIVITVGISAGTKAQVNQSVWEHTPPTKSCRTNLTAVAKCSSVAAEIRAVWEPFIISPQMLFSGLVTTVQV